MLVNIVWGLTQFVVLMGTILGLGHLVTSPWLRARLPMHWELMVNAVAGMVLVQFSTQLLLVCGLGSRSALQALSLGLLGLGASGWIALLLRRLPAPDHGLRALWNAAPRSHRWLVALPLLAAATSFIIAAAPSTKHDEVHYHMLVPKRILEDGGLLAYLLPDLASNLPHVQFQIAQSLLHAWGLPDSANLVSAGFAVLLAVFLFLFVIEATQSLAASAIAASTGVVGLHAAVNYTTAGPHALGDAALAAACALLLTSQPLRERIGEVRVCGMVGLFTAAAAATKISLLPLGLLVTAVMLAQLHAKGGPLRPLVLAAATPWLIVLLPLAAYSVWLTGSPFGPFFFGSLFGVAPPAELAQLMERHLFFDRNGWLPPLRSMVMAVPSLVPLCMLGLAAPGPERRSRLVLLALLCLQLLAIIFFMPQVYRYLSGLLFASVLGAALLLQNPDWREKFERYAVAVALVLLAPHLAVQIYYAAPFASHLAARESRVEFLNRYVGWMADFRQLDGLLPADAVLITDWRIAAFHAPRKVIFTLRDLPPGRPLFLLTGGGPENFQLDGKRRASCDTEVYRNSQATLIAYRTPGREAVRGTAVVYGCKVDRAD